MGSRSSWIAAARVVEVLGVRRPGEVASEPGFLAFPTRPL